MRTSESLLSATKLHDVSSDIGAADATYSPPLRGLIVGTAGTVKVDLPGNTGYTIPANCLAVGVQHAFGGISKVYMTGTSATEVIGLE